ncbi:MAG: glucose 1-dehydrogenase [Sandaracinaceae bacterium]
MSAWDLDGRIAVVTGGSRGIGRAVVEELAQRGARVIAVARGADELGTMAEAVGESVEPLLADVTTDEGRMSILRAVATAGEGRLHVLVNNAGTNVRKGTLEFGPEDLDRVLDVNLRAVWELTRLLHPALKAAAPAAVVQVSSVAAHRAVRSSTAAYAASKGGLDAMSRYLAAEWAPDGIRVNTVAPWYIRTELAEEVLADPSREEAILERTPLGRLGRPEDVARAVAFLAMPASDWLTGVTIEVDGGFSTLGL